MSAPPPPTNLTPGKKRNNKKKSKNNLAKEAAIQAADSTEKTNGTTGVEPEESPKEVAQTPVEANGDTAAQTQELPIHSKPEEETTATPQTNGVSHTEDSAETSAEVEDLRAQLAQLKESHESEVVQLKKEIEEATIAKDDAEERYQALHDRIDKIKLTVREKLNQSQEDVDDAKDRADELEAQNSALSEQIAATEEKVNLLNQQLQEANRELSDIRSRNNLSARNWSKEKEDLVDGIRRLREELQSTSSAMGEWEVIAMEERALKDSYVDKVTSLEEQLGQLNESYLAVNTLKDQQDVTIEQLQRALAELQETRRRELREMVESHEDQLKGLKQTAQEALKRAETLVVEKEALSKELERAAPFEKEVNEKNLLIGKLRHEAIVLNEHLTKALRYMKKTKPQDQVDRQIVTNQLVHFLSLDRSDPKRFQILQVMASYLQFTDGEREQAGLARPGTATNSLRLPASPFGRTPSSPSLHSEFFSNPEAGGTSGTSSKETLTELWSHFLQQSAQDGESERNNSVSSVGTRAESNRG